MGSLASGPGRADGAVALVQVVCSIYQGYTSRFPGYIRKATMLLVSELGASRKGNRGKLFILDLRYRGEGDHDYTDAPKIFLECVEFRKRISAQRTPPSSFPSAFNPKECGQFGCR
jgi:hypothetical protein